MGAGSSTKKFNLEHVGPLLYETQFFLRWTVEDVRKLHWHFKNTIHGFALVEPQFECLMAFKEDSLGDMGLPTVFKVLDNDNDGRIDALEFLGGVALVCRGTFEEKARLCFEIFDFNLNAHLSRQELAMMMQSTICGMICLSGGTEEMEPDLDEIDKLVDEAFEAADVDKSSTIIYTEFVTWARSKREVMGCLNTFAKINDAAAVHDESDDSAEERRGDRIAQKLAADMTRQASDIEDAGIDAEGAMVEDSDTRDPSSTNGGSVTGSGVSMGDQWAASKAFVGALYEPTDYKPHPDSGKLPDSNLEIEWVHGYRSFDSRNNLRYITTSEPPSRKVERSRPPTDPPPLPRSIVYPCAALAVVYDVENNVQRHYRGHTDDIISLALHPAGHVVATGQVGKDPVIHVWDSRSMQCLSTLSGFHQRGVALVAFSQDGSRCASVGLDNDHSVALHEWESGKLVASGIGHQNKVLGMASSTDGRNIVIVGVRFIKFLHTEGRALKARSGRIGREGAIQIFPCVTFIDDDAVVGTVSGQVYRFDRQGQLVQVVQAHGTGDAVLAMHYVHQKKQLLTGGKDAMVMTWDSQLKAVGHALDLTDVASTDKRTNSVMTIDAAVASVHCTQGFLLVGSRGGQIIEIETSTSSRDVKSRMLANSHSSGELLGLDTSPAKAEFVTAGEDRTLRVWSLRRLCQLRIRALPCPARAVSYSPCGKHVCIGMTTGAVAVVEDSLQTVVTSWHHAKRSISDIKYSPDSKTLATASHDCNIYLYSVDVRKNTYARRAVCKGHSSTVTHIDFSLDSRVLQSTSADYELLFWESSGTIHRSASKLRDVTWATWTSTLGWPVQGVWPSTADGTDINTVDRSLKLGVLATGDDSGFVKLFRYPCAEKGAMFQCYRGHSAHVTNVRFSKDHRFLISVGGADKSIIQWRHDVEDLESSSDDDDDEDRREKEAQDAADNVASVVQERIIPSVVKEIAKPAASGGDEFQAVKPYLGAIVAPSGPKPKEQTSTDVDLNLEWVFGYRSRDCRNNVRYTAGGDLVYNAAALGVVYHKSRHAQSFLQGAHTDDIISLALHPNGKIVATGEVGKKPKIIVWDAETKDVKAVLQGELQRGVSLLAFDKTGAYVAGIGLDDQHSLAIYDWGQKRLVALAPTHKDKVFALSFFTTTTSSSSSVSKTSRGVNPLVTCGQQEVRFWTVSGRDLNCQKAVFAGKGPKQAMVTAAAMDNCVVTGAVDGTLYVWSAHRLVSTVPDKMTVARRAKGQAVEGVHKSAVQAMYALEREKLLVTGDKDGCINIWQVQASTDLSSAMSTTPLASSFSNNAAFNRKDASLQEDGSDVTLVNIFTCSLREVLPQERIDLSIRSVCIHKSNLLVGTASSEILEAKLKKDQMGWQCVSRAHHSGELWGLAVHPSKRVFATGGDDGILRVWDIDTRKEIASASRSDKIRAVAYKPDGARIAAGLYNGQVEIMEIDDGRLTLTGTPPEPKMVAVLKGGEGKAASKRPIQEVKYSFDGSVLAVGSHDSSIYVYDASEKQDSEKYRLIAKLSRHSSYITHVDFGLLLPPGLDCSALRVTGDGRVLDVTSGKPLSDDIRGKCKLVMQSTSGAYELLFWSCQEGDKKWTQEPSATKLRDVCWATWTSPFGWPVQSIFSAGQDGTDINAVDRSGSYHKVPVVATADDMGKVRLYPYPCMSKACLDKSYYGHSSHVTNLRFAYDDSFLISVGGGDCCAFVWRTDCIEEAREVDMAVAAELDTLPEDILQEAAAPSGVASTLITHDQHVGVLDVVSPEEIVLKVEATSKPSGGGDEFMAVKPWVGAIREPSSYDASKQPKDAGEPPATSLELAHVYGFRAQDVRSNLLYAGSASEFVYHAAAVGIVYNSEQHKQRYNLSHTDDILSLAVYAKGSMVATGEIGKKPKIVVWDWNSGNTLQVLAGFHTRGVALLAFSSSGRYLASVGLDDDHHLAIYNLEKETLVAKEKVERSKPLGLAFGGDSEVVATGVGFVKFFTVNEQRGKLESKKGALKATTDTVLCVGFLQSDVVTGHYDGSLALWKGRCMTQRRQGAHGKAVNTMHTCRRDKDNASAALVTGGADGLVILWDLSLNPLRTFDVNQFEKPPLLGEVRSVCMYQSSVLVGTKSSEILELEVTTGATKVHVRAHFKDELWGLACHPCVSQVATVGDEGTVIVWDTVRRDLVHMQSVKAKARALAYSPNGAHLAVALFSGDLTVLSEDLVNVVAQTNVSRTWIQAMAYSPDNTTLAAGSHDGNIHLLNVANYSRRAVLRGHHSYITHVDFSADSSVMQSNCGAYELLFWNANKGTQITSAMAVRDTSWATWTCTLGWPVQGIWPAGADGTDINSVDKAKNVALLVTGDDSGKVNLFRYPCVERGSKHRQYAGHSSHVTNVRFSKDDRFVLSVGGADRCLMQWKVKT